MPDLMTRAQATDLDGHLIRSGLSQATLMRRAATAVADVLSDRCSIDHPVLVACGPGNNGGDGYLAAEILKNRGWRVTVQSWDGRAKPNPAARAARAEWSGPVAPLDAARLRTDRETVVIDALYGAGLNRDLPAEVRAFVEATNRHRVFAVDIPSGVCGTSGLVRGAAPYAHATVTFEAKKLGHALFPGRERCGDVVVAPLTNQRGGWRPSGDRCWENDPLIWAARLPMPERCAHKYTRGHAMIFSPNPDLSGAARLAAQAAARAGAGITSILANPAAASIHRSRLDAILVREVPDPFDRHAVRHSTAHHAPDAILFGPGAGRGPDTRRLCDALVGQPYPLVFDADALSAYARASDGPPDRSRPHDVPRFLSGKTGARHVLTPHTGEFTRVFPHHSLVGEAGKLGAARAAARETKAVVVIKGADTVIAAPDGRALVNTNAPADLATAGSGDVLAGTILGFLAAGMPAFDAAGAAVWLLGEAATHLGPHLVATDLPDAIAAAATALKNRRGEPADGPKRQQAT